MKKWCLIPLMLFILGCSTSFNKFNPDPPTLTKINNLEEYKIDLSKIKKPSKLQPIYVDDNFKEVEIEKAQYIVLTPKEYSKVGFLVQLSSTYKEIIKQEEKLINNNIKQFNHLNNIKKLNDNQTKYYFENWVNTENILRESKLRHERSEFITKIGLYLITGVAFVSLL